MVRVLSMALLVGSLAMPAVAVELNDDVKAEHRRCTSSCRIKVVDCEEQCNRKDRDSEKEVACLEVCHGQLYESCRNQCRDSVRALLEASQVE